MDKTSQPVKEWWLAEWQIVLHFIGGALKKIIFKIAGRVDCKFNLKNLINNSCDQQNLRELLLEYSHKWFEQLIVTCLKHHVSFHKKTF